MSTARLFTAKFPRLQLMTSVVARKTRSLGRIPHASAQVSYPHAPTRLYWLQRRALSTTLALSHGHTTPPKSGEELYVSFIDKDGTEHRFAVSAGDNLLDIAQDANLDMEGACGGSCACSTCHVIIEDAEMYGRIPEAEDDENDMLDLAFGLTETSRLGCQVVMTKELDGLRVKLPAMTRNLQASDFQ